MKTTVTKGSYRSGTEYWLVTCFPFPGERGERKFFPDKRSADEFITDLYRESSETRPIPELLKLEARDFEKLLQPHGWTLRRAVEYVLKNAIPFEQKPVIRDAVALYLDEQKSLGLAKETIWDIKYRTAVFAAKFGDRHLHEVTLEDYSKWKQELANQYAPRSVGHFLRHASSFIRWSIPYGYCSHNFITALKKPKVKQKRPQVLTCHQVEALFEIAFRHGLLAWAVLGTLVGIRPGEMRLLGRLGDVLNLAEGYIKVDGDAFSPEERRVIRLEGDLRKALTAWLSRCRLEDPIVPQPERKHVEALRQELGFWSHNVMRHTAASLHYAFFENAGKTMKMLGHSPTSDVFDKHYKALLTRAEAKAVYALRPS
ncbi:MAG TPA: hypothetical protein VL171_18880 [Verrucomicrobiae bacterium]|nr:hypothetical protein [Verrucomicrobiae bacterium]